jgi:hypothetical protein
MRRHDLTKSISRKDRKAIHAKEAKRLRNEKCIPGLKFHLPQIENQARKIFRFGKHRVASKLAKTATGNARASVMQRQLATAKLSGLELSPITEKSYSRPTKRRALFIPLR